MFMLTGDEASGVDVNVDRNDMSGADVSVDRDDVSGVGVYVDVSGVEANVERDDLSGADTNGRTLRSRGEQWQEHCEGQLH